MSRLAMSGLLLALVLPSAALAAEEISVGQMVFPRIGAKATIDGKEVEAIDVPIPPVVDEIDGEQLRVGRMWLAKRDVLPVEAAMGYYTDQIENHRSSWAWVGRSAVWMSTQKYREAIADLNEAVRLDPKNPTMYCNRAMARYALAEHADAAYALGLHSLILADLDAAVRLDPACAGAFRTRGCLLANAEKYREALVDLDKSVRLDPKQPATYNDRGWVRFELGKYELAIDDHNAAIKLDPSRAAYYHRRAVARFEMGDVDGSIDDYGEAIRRDPAFADAFAWRGDSWRTKGDLDQAIADYSEAIRLKPLARVHYVNRGTAWRLKGEYDEAIADFSEVIRLDPSTTAYTDRAAAWLAKGQHEKAIADFSAAIRIDPAKAAPYVNRAIAWQMQGEWDKAIAGFSEAIRIAPTEPDAYNGLAWILGTHPDAHFRDGKKAVGYATKACELTEWKSTAYIDTLAAACAEAGDFESAVKWQSKAIDLLTSDAEKKDFGTRLELYQAGKPYRDMTVQ